MLRSVVIFASLTLATAGGLLFGCEGPESFQLEDDGGSILAPHDAGAGGSQLGTGGAMAPGTGGAIAPGSGGRTGMAGAPAAGGSEGGSNAGGQNGTAGSSAPSGGAVGTAGGNGIGGSVAASGGAPGNGGGPAGTGGMGGVGMMASGGDGGRAGGGSTGTAGRGGNAGSSGGAGGSGGAAGAGGAPGGTGPCAGVCANPTKVTTQSYSSPNFGLGAACFETTANIQGGNCYNFAGRTLKLNGTSETCTAMNWPTPLPAKKNGGYCIDISAGSNSSAGFTTF